MRGELFDFGFVILVLLAFYSKPRFLYNLGQTLIGRIALLLVVIFMASRDAMVGLAACLLYFDMAANVREGLTGSEDSSSEPGASSDVPAASNAPASDAPASDAPASDAPASDAPASDAPASDAPASDASAPATPAPTASAPATPAPATPAPATPAPATPAPATPAPTPSAPSVASPKPNVTMTEPSKTDMTPEAFRSAHCSLDTNSLVTANGQYVCMSDVQTVFPQIMFPEGQSLCDPCDPSCVFQITDQMTVEHKLKGMGQCKAQPLKKVTTTSGPMSTIPPTCYDDIGALKDSCSNPITYHCPGGATVIQDPTKPELLCPCDGEVKTNPLDSTAHSS
jgi:hypothetical protein